MMPTACQHGARAHGRPPRSRSAPGGAGGPTSRTGPGAPSARTTAPTATPGTTSRTTSPAARPTAGARTASPASATATSSSCFAPAFWNGRDPILKERLFGLTPAEGNHGEDVKEYYFYLDNTPTHSYMKFLYKYPQAEYPVRPAGRGEPRGGRPRAGVRAARHRHLRRRPLLRHLRRVRQGDPGGHLHPDRGVQPRPGAGAAAHPAAPLVPQHLGLGRRAAAASRRSAPGRRGRRLRQPGRPTTRRRDRCATSRSTTGSGRATLYGPGRRRAAVHRQRDERAARLRARRAAAASRTSRTPSTATSSTARTCRQPGARSARRRRPLSRSTVPAGRLGRPPPAAHRPSRPAPTRSPTSTPIVDAAAGARPTSSTTAIHPPRRHRRRAAASSARRSPGLLWTQADLPLRRQPSGSTATTPTCPPPASRASDPQPALAAPQLDAGHDRCPTSGSIPGSPPGTSPSTASPFALVDPEFAKDQLWLLLFEQFQHPNGQIPAYEWEFSDLNPPVHAWAVWRVYNMDRIRIGQGRPRVPGDAASTSC